MLHSPHYSAIKAHASKVESELTQQFHNLDIEYAKSRSKDYGALARETFSKYEDANSHYRELAALGVSPALLEVEAAIISSILADYHRYERLCAEYGFMAIAASN